MLNALSDSIQDSYTCGEKNFWQKLAKIPIYLTSIVCENSFLQITLLLMIEWGYMGHILELKDHTF